MSIRAYKLKKIDFEDNPTFNLWHDDLVNDLLGMDGMETLNENGGIAYIERETVENAIENLEEYKDHEQYQYSKETLGTVLKECDEYGVEYYCF